MIMGCYGIGPSRVMGAVVEIHHDDKGIIWPESIAPFKVHLLQIGSDEFVGREAEKVYDELVKEGIEILFDDRPDITAGKKFADADLLGLPYRLVVSAKTKNKIEIKKRTEKESGLVDLEKLTKLLK